MSMQPISGMKLDAFPISGLRRIRDLLYFDGPLLTEYVHSSGDHFLFYWCDCDDESDRWMILRVSESNILRLENRLATLDEIIPGAAQDDYVYFADIQDGSQWKTKPVHLTQKSMVPNEYAPKKGTLLSQSRAAEDARTYPILIEGGWSVSDLGEFPKWFSQAYSIIYCMVAAKGSRFRGLPWRGGFSAMHFFNRALESIPAADRPGVAAVQYSSPGFMRFSLDREIAKEVRTCIDDLDASPQKFRDIYNDLEAFIRQNKLNELAESNIAEWAKHNQRLIDGAKDLIEGFSVMNPDEFVKAAPRPFEAAKTTMAFYRRIRDLAHFRRSGQVIFPII